MSFSRRTLGDAGQSVVELALVLPIIVMLMLAVVQMGFVAGDYLLLHHAAREAARAAAVDPSHTAAAEAAKASANLDVDRLQVDLRGDIEQGGLATVRVDYRSPTIVPVVGHLIGDVDMAAEVTMRVE